MTDAAQNRKRTDICRFGIVTALPKEFAAVLAMLDKWTPYSVKGDPNEYVIGSIAAADGSGSHSTIVTLLKKAGNNSAAAATSALLLSFPELRDVLMVGIAGGCPQPSSAEKHVRLGDIVVSNEFGIVQYDNIKLALDTVELRETAPASSARLLSKVRLLEAGRIAGSYPWELYIARARHLEESIRPDPSTDRMFEPGEPVVEIPHPHDEHRRLHQPRVHYGRIGSSNVLLKNPKLRDELSKKFNVRAIEMEGSGIADAAWTSGSGHIIVRGICDYCDANKNDTWQGYAAVVAAAYARALIELFPAEEGSLEEEQRETTIEQYLSAITSIGNISPYPQKNALEIERPVTGYMPLQVRFLANSSGVDPRHGQGETLADALKVLKASENKKLLILGQPGSGKTTLLHELAANSWSAPEAIGLASPHLPLIVPLRQLAGAEGSFEERLLRILPNELFLSNPMPRGFLTDWPTLANKAWILFFDGLDELTEDSLPVFAKWFKGLLETFKAHPILIVARSSIDRTNIADRFFPEMRSFTRCELLPVTEAQRNSFTLDRFGETAVLFSEQFEKVCSGELRGNPLLLNIAAKVYEENGSLPERQSVLYDEFVNIWLKEADRRGLPLQLEEKIYKLTRPALAELAKMMTFDSSDLSEAKVGRYAARYLAKTLDISEDEARYDGTRFVRAAAQHTGVFVRHARLYDFIHPTLREYLAASALDSNSRRQLRALHLAVDFLWRDSAWYEVLLFLLNILSDDPSLSDHLVAHVFRKAHWDRFFRIRSNLRMMSLLFVAECLIRRVAVKSTTRGDIVGELRRLSGDLRVPADYRVAFLGALGDLGFVDEAATALIRFAVDDQIGLQVREAALGCLFGLNRAYALFASAYSNIPPADFQRSAHEALLVGDLAGDLLSLTRDRSIGPSLRNSVILYLSAIGGWDKLLAVARDVQVPIEQRSLATLLFIDGLDAPGVLPAAMDDNIYAELHDPLCELLGRQEGAGSGIADAEMYHALIFKLAAFVLRDPRSAEKLLEEAAGDPAIVNRLIRHQLRTRLGARR